MDWLKSLPQKNWVDYLQINVPVSPFSTEAEKKDLFIELIDEARLLIAKGKVGISIDRLSLLAYIDKNFLFERLKAAGMLKNSAYLPGRSPVAGIARHFIQHKDFFALTSKEENYFQSLINFEKNYDQLSQLSKQMDTSLRDFKKAGHVIINEKKIAKSRLKSLLAFNESSFLYEAAYDPEFDDPSQLAYYTKEEISEAISFLIVHYNKVVGITENDVLIADDVYSSGEAIKKLVVTACMYKNMLDIEILIEYYGYTLFYDDKNLVLKSAETFFGQSMDLSNIMYEVQNDTHQIYNSEAYKNALSLKELAEAYHKKEPDNFELKSYPLKRYVIKINTGLFIYFLNQQQQVYFKEEIPLVDQLQKEMNIPLANLPKYEITEDLSLSEFFRIFRFFVMKYYVVEGKFQSLTSPEQRQIANNSLVAVYKKKELIDILEQFAGSQSVAKFLSIVSWDVVDKESFLDLQYTPIIVIGDYFLIQTTVLARSNLLRSIFYSESKKGNNFKNPQIANHESLEYLLEKVFLEKGFVCHKGISVKFKTLSRNESDIDFLAFKDGVLFIAECKDSTHPTNLFELRTTVGYIHKAKVQLDYILAAIKDATYANVFKQKTGIRPEEIIKIVPVIVLSNRKFWGYEFGGYPVRNIKELEGFVHSGKWNYKLPDEEVRRFQLWQQAQFQAKDIATFCGPESPHQIMFESMSAYRKKLIGNIYQENFNLNIVSVIEKLEEKYHYEIVDTETYFSALHIDDEKSEL